MHDKKYNNKTNTFIQGLRPFSKSLPHGLKRLLKKGSYNFSNIVDNWAKMVGRELSNACYPSTVKMGKEMSNGTLILNVIHGNEIIVEYSKQEIMDKINSFFRKKNTIPILNYKNSLSHQLLFQHQFWIIQDTVVMILFFLLNFQ